MSPVQLQLLLVVVLIALNAAFAGSEIALISLREGQVERLERRGGGGKLLAKLARNPNQFLATIQIGITLAGFLASATAAVALAEPLVEPLAFLGDFARPGAIVVVTVVLTFVTLVIGELAPKRIAMQRAEGWALLAARPLSMIAKLATPAVWLLGKSTDIVVRLAGGDPSLQREEVTEEELRDLLATRPGFSRVQRGIVEGAFEIRERTVAQIAVPRTNVTWLEADMTMAAAADAMIAAGHSRAPVCEGDLDQVVGVVHLRELVGVKGSVRDAARPAQAVPESAGVLAVLRQLQRDRQHLAVVVDEYGGIAGVVTIEDVLEEFVGEIYDEFDPDIAEVRHDPDGSILVVGTFPAHDLHDLGVQVEQGRYTTVAGLLLDRLGHLPDVGEHVEEEGWRFTVEGVEDRAITRVRLRSLAGDQPADAAPE